MSYPNAVKTLMVHTVYTDGKIVLETVVPFVYTVYMAATCKTQLRCLSVLYN